MFSYLRKLFKTGGSRNHASNPDAPLSDSKVTAIGSKSSSAEPRKSRHDAKVTRALTRKASRMKLERILEKTVKRR
jgi:hypothetical protein